MTACLVAEPPILQEVEVEIGKLIDQFTSPALNLPKFVILNEEAYKELIEYYAELYGIEEYPSTVLDVPIVLDMQAKDRVRVFANAYTEYYLRK